MLFVHTAPRFPADSQRHHLLLAGGLLLIALAVWPVSALAQPEINDSTITEAVDVFLFNDPAVPAHRIDISTQLGVVELSGTVPDILAKERAAAVAEAVKGVRSVVNRITVDIPYARRDHEIQADVKRLLLENPTTDSYEVGVTVTAGVVTLTGTVDSWQEKEMAARVAKKARGVVAVENTMDILYPADRSDAEIKRDVTSRLKWDQWVSDSLIEVSVQNDVVTLSGTVGSAAEKTRARMDAWVLGVSDVNTTDLKVDWTLRHRMRKDQETMVKDDQAIRRAVMDALLFDPRVNSFNPEVKVDNGVATLTGVVDNLQARLAAEEDARNTVGVWRVKNLLKVRPLTIPVDAAIAADVQQSLLESPFTEAYQIDVTVHNGIVTLQGTVDSVFERRMAWDLASQVQGVVEVKNRLDLRTPATDKPDWEIAMDIYDELFWSPFVDADQVTVEVENGVATLTGQVDSWSEHLAAGENALEGGATSVVNSLEVKGAGL